VSERSEREREAARLERERRRAEREGKAPAPVEPSAPIPPPGPEPEPEPQPPAPEPQPPVASEPEPPIEPASPAEPPPPAESGPPTRVRRIPPAGAPRRVMPAHPEAEEDDGAGVPVTSPGPQPGAPGMPRHPLSVPSRGRRRRSPARVAVLGGLIALVLALLAFAAFSIWTPFKGDGTGRVAVTIPAGSSAREVGNLLADKGVVGSGFFFSLRAAIGGDRDKLRAGRFVLHHDMSNGAAITALTTPPPKVAQVSTLLIPEGPGRREVAPLVAKAGVPGDYLAASKRSPSLNPRDYGAPRGTPSLEGFLFPATYRLKRGTTARGVVAQQVQAYKDNTAGISYRRAKRKNLTRYDVLIIASMIERETAVPRERRLISGVIYNRLKQGIPLGIDATTRYDENNWSRPLTNTELTRDSPFNTRRNKGLPPTPIGNPGLASIRAAARPAATRALFYVVKPCANGAHAFSRTDAQFQADVAAYQRKRAELGGKDPSTCPK